MRILVLDDNKIERKAPDTDILVNPHDYREDEFVQTVNVKTFIDKFFRQEWDEVWIDNDLGDPTQNGRTATKEIYNYILGSNRKMASSPLIRITTMNVSAATTLLSDLVACDLNAIICPISSLDLYGVSRGDLLIKD